MRIIVNGKDAETANNATILTLLQEKELDPSTVVVELNRNIITGEDYAATALSEGDRLEVLRFVGGG